MTTADLHAAGIRRVCWMSGEATVFSFSVFCCAANMHMFFVQGQFLFCQLLNDWCQLSLLVGRHTLQVSVKQIYCWFVGTLC